MSTDHRRALHEVHSAACRTMPLSSAPVGMDWEGHAAFDDDFIIAKHRALTLPAHHESACTGFGGANINTGAKPIARIMSWLCSKSCMCMSEHQHPSVHVSTCQGTSVYEG